MILGSNTKTRFWVAIALVAASTITTAQTSKPVARGSAQPQDGIQAKKTSLEPTSFMEIAFDRPIFESKPKCDGLETFIEYVKAAAAKQLPSGGCAYYQENEGRISAARLIINAGESISTEVGVVHDEGRKPIRMSGDFERDNWNVVRTALLQKYGAPSKRVQRQIQNALGVVTDAEDLTWDWPSIVISATSAKNFTQGSFLIVKGSALSDWRKSNQNSSASDIAKKL